MLFQQIADKISSFVKKASKNPLWVFGWAVFITCITYSTNFIVDYPSQIAIIDNNAVRFNTYSQDYNESLQVHEILKESYDSFINVTNEYNAIIAKLNNKTSVSKDEVSTALAHAKSTKDSLSVATGTLQGVDFNNDVLDKYVLGFIENISGKQKIVGVIADYYQELLTNGDTESLKPLQIQLQEFIDNTYQNEAKYVEQLKNFGEEFDTFYSHNMVDITAETNKLVIFRRKMQLVAVAIIYILGFSAFGIYTLTKKSSKPKPKTKAKR